MVDNIALVSEISRNETGQILANIQGKWSYSLTFDVVGECRFDIRLRNNVTNKVMKNLSLHNEFITGSYKFPFISLEDGVLVYDFNGVGGGIITNIKVIKGAR